MEEIAHTAAQILFSARVSMPKNLLMCGDLIQLAIHRNGPLASIEPQLKLQEAVSWCMDTDTLIYVYPLTDLQATVRKFERDLLAHLRNVFLISSKLSVKIRKVIITSLSFKQFFYMLYVAFMEVVGPLTLILLLLVNRVASLLLTLRCPLSLLSFWTFCISGWFTGSDCLAEGENGFSCAFTGGTDVPIKELRKELLTRNLKHTYESIGRKPVTIAVSYKHYADKDGERICLEDLRAMARLIKQAGKCRIRFWIDSKLPKSNDDTFERWIARGVTPYGRYPTFLCPSAQRMRDTSFWLSNEFHFAASGKGMIYITGEHLYLESRFGYRTTIHQRYLEIVTGSATGFRDERRKDRDMAVRWAMSCLTAVEPGINSLFSNRIDCLDPQGEKETQSKRVWDRIDQVVDAFGEQKIAVTPGSGWNRHDLLLPKENGDDFSTYTNWYGFCFEDRCIVYFVRKEYVCFLSCALAGRAIRPDGEPWTHVVVLEVGLNTPFCSGDEIRVVKKVLKKMSWEHLGQATFVTLPWLCNWI